MMKADVDPNAANRMRTCRQRRRDGRHVVRITYPDSLPLALAGSGFLGDWDTENEIEIARAIERVLQAVCVSAGYDVTGSDDGTV
jgi:hypothetical protein